MKWLMAVTALATGTSGLAAQSWTSRVTGAKDGDVRVAFAARDGICGDGETYIRDRNREGFMMMREYDGSRNWRTRPCDDGPVRVAIRVRSGAVRSARVYVGGGWRAGTGTDATTDLGLLGAQDAVKGLLLLAREGGGRNGGDLIFPVTLADSVVVWPDLLALARDRDAVRESRKQAVFWVSQLAGDKAAEGLGNLAEDEGEDREVRDQAVFALSQLPKDEGIPILIRVARTNKSREIRRKAMFWLGQSEDPRALALFEEILARP